MPYCDHLKILGSTACNKTYDSHENENRKTVISAYVPQNADSNTEEKFRNIIMPKKITYKNIINGNKPGLTELSNDKTYLENEIPLRKRIKAEVEFLHRKNIQKQYDLPFSDASKEIKSINFSNYEKCFSEELNATKKLNLEETSDLGMFSDTDLNTLKFKKLTHFQIRKCNSSQNSIPITKLNSKPIEMINVNCDDKSLTDNIKYVDNDSSDSKFNSEKNINAFDMEALSEFEISILADESMHENINAKENDDYETSLLENDTVTNDDMELISVKDSDILEDKITATLDAIVTDQCETLIEQNRISMSTKIHKSLTHDSGLVTDERNITRIETCGSLEIQNTNYPHECVEKFELHTNKCINENSEKRIIIKDCNIVKDQNITPIPENMSRFKSLSETNLIIDIELDKKENNLAKSKVSDKVLENMNKNSIDLNFDQGISLHNNKNITDKIILNEKNEFPIREKHCLINDNEKTTFTNKNYLNICIGNKTLITDKNVSNNMDSIVTFDENTKSKKITIDQDVSFKKEMSSVSNEIYKTNETSVKSIISNEIVSNNNTRELNIKKEFEEEISKNLENVSGDVVKETFKGHVKSVNREEIKQNIDQIPDYYEDEKEDLINPGWDTVKELSNDEERYRQVKDCWKSATIPNPNKNLTYHSFRKRNLNKEEISTRVIKPRKRQATSNLNKQNTKRSRLCTFTFDNHIQSKVKEKNVKVEELKKEMKNKINYLNELCNQQEIRLQSYQLCSGNKTIQKQNYSELRDIRIHYQQKISSVTREYRSKINEYDHQYQSRIDALKKNRNEVFQFYNFYKGLQDEQKDPTILTSNQLEELNEIENIYLQLNNYYK
ncbi:uncharacterized protein NPIL_361281 [Nephila pilipes]|uniref:Uncharacterized protein n=1 Tax=Nephila pilipes TaxID=299642 RepID=A0A8X6NRI8_NEPPI|nr:uncharacterized protein NPIL_361281 [Nephila pilipes]